MSSAEEKQVASEAKRISAYSQRYQGGFYRHLGLALREATVKEQCSLKEAFPDWWERSLRNYVAVTKRGVKLPLS